MVKRLGSLLQLGAILMTPLFAANSVHEFTMNNIDGQTAPLSAYKGKVLLIVNVASQCGFTPQYEGLPKLYASYKDKGLVVIGFPANNFMGQEPGSDAEIKQFCSRKYNVNFPMYSKISVKGGDKAPLYEYLTGAGGGEVKWNFTKFLVDGEGRFVKRFEPRVAPESPEMIAAIEAALKK
jgi:glutathione peroxidase